MRTSGRRLFLLALVLVVPPVPASATPPEPRTDAFGDPLPEGVRFRLGGVRLRHDDSVTTVAFSPDGKVLASGGEDGTVRLWHVPDGKEIRRLDLRPRIVTCVTFSPDGRILASAAGGIRLWDPATGKELRRLGDPGALLHCLAFSPDGKTLAATDGSKIRLYSIDTGKEQRELPGGAEHGDSLAFSPDGKTLAALAEDRLCYWDPATGSRRPGPKADGAFCVRFSPDGKTLAAAAIHAIEDNCILLWDWPAGTERWRLTGRRLCPCTVTFAGDGKVLAATGEDYAIRVLDPATGKELRRLEGGERSSLQICASPDGSLLAAADGGPMVLLWDLRARQGSRSLSNLGRRMACVALAPDGKTLVTSARDETLAAWDTRDGRHLRNLDGWNRIAETLAISANGKVAAEAHFLFHLGRWDLASGKRLALETTGEERFCATLSPDGRIFARGEVDGIHLRETATGKELRRLIGGEVRAGREYRDWTPDGRILAALGQLWDTHTGRQLPDLEGRLTRVEASALSADGRLAAVFDYYDPDICLYEIASGRLIGRCRGYEDSVRVLAFSPDGRTLASAGGHWAPPGADAPTNARGTHPEAGIRLWDVEEGKLLRTLPPHQGPARSLAFSFDGSLLVAGNEDDSVLGWEVGAVTGRRRVVVELSARRLAALWSDLAGDAARGQRAVLALSDDPGAALPALQMRLALEWARPAGVEQRIADLDHEEFARREQASRELEEMGEPAAPALCRALDARPSPEARRRLHQLMDRLDRREPTPRRLRLVRAVQVLERIGTPEARRALSTLAREAPGTRLAEEATASLRRLERRAALESGM